MVAGSFFSQLAHSGLLPEMSILFGIFIICFLAYLLPVYSKGISLWVALISLGIAFYFSGSVDEIKPLQSMGIDPWTGILKRYFCIATAATLFAWLEWKQARIGDISSIFIALLLAACLSLMMLVQAADLWLMIISAEAFSFSAYGIASSNQTEDNSHESILRYFGIGALATSVSVFGLTWVIGFRESMPDGLLGFQNSEAFFPVAGAVFFLAFLFFKLGSFPFHAWVPGIFRTAPTPVAGFLAASPKVAAGFACLHLVQILDVNLSLPFVVLALFTGIFGNIAAFRASGLREMLAYSAIGQASFLVIPAIFSRQVSGAAGHLLYFSLSYAVAIQAAFFASQYFENQYRDRLSISDSAGFFRFHPLAVLVLTAILFSIIGIPPFAGFTGKLLVMSGLPAGLNLLPSGMVALLFLVGIINTVLAAGYFLKIPYSMIFKPSLLESHPLRSSSATLFLLLMGLVFLIAAFLFPAFFFSQDF